MNEMVNRGEKIAQNIFSNNLLRENEIFERSKKIILKTMNNVQ